MTPKEKAKELVNKYDGFLTYIESKGKAEQCAMASVDEMINLLMTMNKYMMFPEQVEYLQKVKKEIEKL